MKFGHMAFECNAPKAFVPKSALKETNTTIHVANLPLEITEKMVRDTFWYGFTS